MAGVEIRGALSSAPSERITVPSGKLADMNVVERAKCPLECDRGGHGFVRPKLPGGQREEDVSPIYRLKHGKL